MNPNLFFPLFIPFFLRLVSVSVTVLASHLDMHCEVSNCGGITNISYPFWLSGKQPSYCGFPAFELLCKDDIPFIEMPFGVYEVKQIFYDNSSFVVADHRLVTSECPVFYRNLSFSVTPFTINTSVNRELYFFHNCSDVGSEYFKVGCANTVSVFNHLAYLGGDYGSPVSITQTCSLSAYMPVLGYMGGNSSQYRNLIRNGFLLDWTVADCKQCTETNGQCGYNNKTNNFACICDDRLHWKSCAPEIHLPCDTNMINISYPFYTNDSLPGCDITYLIQCIESKPIIQFDSYAKGIAKYTVKNISYSDKTITLLDQDFTLYHPDSNCSFLYNFTSPIPHFDRPHLPIIDGLDRSIYSCKWAKDDFSLLSGNHDYSVCKDFSFYYWTESKNGMPKGVSSACNAPEAPLFELSLSFSELDKYDLSLLWAGFSNSLKLNTDCFSDTVCSSSETKKGRTIAIAASIGAAVFIITCCAVLFWCKRKKRLLVLSNLLSRSTSSKLFSKKDPELGEPDYHTHIFSYDELREATNGFDVSRELGDGGFGTVYKGKLHDGRTVAVKRLYENNYRRLEQFMNEVDILSRLRHQNLVTLYGCTSRRSRELLLVYEYVPNGTVADHLHGANASAAPLLWRDRMSVAIETAEALAYLHAVEPQIIHRDVKSNNILLDNNFHVKVADFGLSRLFPLDATHVSTAPQGTPGYVDPEYHQCYQLTDKSDVYSFGVVLVELISSKPAVDISRTRHEINLANMAVTKIQKCELDQLVDPMLGYRSDLEVKRMITQVAEVAFTCLQPDRDMRPSIKEVLEVLRAIESGSYNAEKGSESVEVQIKEETQLLKNVSPFSPDTVTERWQSRSTTPNTSG